MRTWEDIVKDKMEEFDEALPESVFAEFHAIRSGASPASSQKRFPIVWAIVPAVAAGLATILFLRHPSTPDSGSQIIQHPVQPVAVASDSTEASEPVQELPLIAQANTPKVIRRPDSRPLKHENVVIIEPEEEESKQTAPETAQAPEAKDEKATDEPVVTTTSPLVPERTGSKPVRLRIAPAVGAIAGGGLLAAITTPLLTSGFTVYARPTSPGNPPPGDIVMEPEPPEDEPTGSHTHSFPFKGGLSIGIPVAERLKVTTGLEYSLYQSSFIYTLSGDKKQLAHYLGIPVRLDWTLANNRWLDVYLGGGIEGDYCIGATLAGESVKRDGLSFSLLCAGGIQLNIIDRIGLYIEPELSWNIPSESRVLETWRSEYPFMFSVATGLRINFGK